MNLGTQGVFCFTDALTPVQLTELVQRTEQLGYAALWYPEVLGYESFALGSFLMTQTETLIIASGIANIYARDATAAKQGQPFGYDAATWLSQQRRWGEATISHPRVVRRIWQTSCSLRGECPPPVSCSREGRVSG
jgi:hypothetical protein